MIKTTKTELSIMIDKLGYKISEKDSFNYINKGNPSKIWKARACYIIEKDSGKGFANIEARRDDNFKALQLLRLEEYSIRGRIYEL